MALAEDTGTAVPIGRFAIEHALVQLASWRKWKPDMRLSLTRLGATASRRRAWPRS